MYDVSSTVTNCIGFLSSVRYTDTMYLSTDCLIAASHCTTNDMSVMFPGGNLMFISAVAVKYT